MSTPPPTSLRLHRELKEKLLLFAAGRHMRLSTLISQILWEWVRLETRRYNRRNKK